MANRDYRNREQFTKLPRQHRTDQGSDLFIPSEFGSKIEKNTKMHIYIPKNLPQKESYEKLMFNLFNKYQRKILMVKNSNVALLLKRERDFEIKDRLVSFYNKNSNLNMSCLWEGNKYLNFTVKRIYTGDLDMLLNKNIILNFVGMTDLQRDKEETIVDYFKKFFQSAHRLRDIDNFGLVKYINASKVLQFRVYKNVTDPENINDEFGSIKFKNFLIFAMDLEIL